jgi:CBS domain-containing protein
MTIATLCQRPLVTIDARASLHDAAALMGEQHVGALIVTEDADPPRVVGVATDRDLAIEVVGRRADARDMSIGQLAKGPPVVVRDTASLRDAAAAMEQGGVRRLLVIDAAGGVIGLVSADDLVGAISDELEGLARALRAGILREKAERAVPAGDDRPRPVYPAFGTVAMQ